MNNFQNLSASHPTDWMKEASISIFNVTTKHTVP